MDSTDTTTAIVTLLLEYSDKRITLEMTERNSVLAQRAHISFVAIIHPLLLESMLHHSNGGYHNH